MFSLYHTLSSQFLWCFFFSLYLLQPTFCFLLTIGAFLLLSYICSNPLLRFLLTIGAFLLFFLHLLQSTFLLPIFNWSFLIIFLHLLQPASLSTIQDWSIPSFFLTLAPIHFFAYDPQLEHFPLFPHIYPNFLYICPNSH